MKKLTDELLPPIYLSIPQRSSPSRPAEEERRDSDCTPYPIPANRTRVVTTEVGMKPVAFPASPVHSERSFAQAPISPISTKLNQSKFVEFSRSAENAVSSEFDLTDNSEPDRLDLLLNISVSLTETPARKAQLQPTPDGLFLSREVLHPEFHCLCHQHLVQQFYSRKKYDQWRLGSLYEQFARLNLANPFAATPLTNKFSPNETPCSLIERWIFHYEKEPDLVLSFDFLLNHPTMILCLVFYWVQSGLPFPPLASKRECEMLQKKRNQMRLNILCIFDDEREWRPRQITRNFVIFKFISEFYKWAMEESTIELPQALQQHIRESWRRIHETWLAGEDIKKSMAVSDKHETEMLEKIYDNFECRDKLIADRMTDVADLFEEVDRYAVLMSPLSDYYQTGLGEHSLKRVAGKHTQLSCWLLSFVVRKAKNNLDSAIAYINRYVELLQEFYKRHNYQSAVLFAGVLTTIKAFMPNIWLEMLDRNNAVNLDRQIDKLVESVQAPGFDFQGEKRPIFSVITIYRLLESIKAQSQKQYLNLDFHRRVQKVAKKIVGCRIRLEQKHRQRKAPAVRLNLNQRFLTHYIYEVFTRDSQLCQAPQYHEELKREARKLDKAYCSAHGCQPES